MFAESCCKAKFESFRLSNCSVLFILLSFPLTERAKAFWDKEDVDDIFDTVLEYLDHLKEAFRKKTATDKG